MRSTNSILDNNQEVPLHWVEREIPAWIEKCGDFNTFVENTKICCAGDTWKAVAHRLAEDHWGVREENPHLFFKRRFGRYWGICKEDIYKELLPTSYNAPEGLHYIDCGYNSVYHFYDITMCGLGGSAQPYIDKLLEYCAKHGYKTEVSNTWHWAEPQKQLLGKRVWIYPK